MQAKLFEVRDRATFIPVLAVRMGLEFDEHRHGEQAQDEAEHWLLSRAGYGESSAEQVSYVQLIEINGGGGMSHCDPYDWPPGARTMTVAHLAIVSRWGELCTGAVIDVRYESGETAAPCESERTCTGEPSGS